MRLIDCFIELFIYTIALLKQIEKTDKGFEIIKEKIDEHISTSKSKSKEFNFPSEDYKKARFAVLAWIDEMIANSKWSSKNKLKWRNEPLQYRYHAETRAAKTFFDKLKVLSQNQKEIIEVFYTCLCLGFKGKYLQENDEYDIIEKHKSDSINKLVGSSLGKPSIHNSELFRKAYPSESEKGKNNELLKNLYIFVSPLMVLVIIYFSLQYILFLTSENIMRVLSL